LDYRYYHKRNYFLAIIYHSLVQVSQQAASPFNGASVQYAAEAGDARRARITLSLGKGAQASHTKSKVLLIEFRTRPEVQINHNDVSLFSA
jgi:hypothetical protein